VFACPSLLLPFVVTSACASRLGGRLGRRALEGPSRARLAELRGAGFRPWHTYLGQDRHAHAVAGGGAREVLVQPGRSLRADDRPGPAGPERASWAYAATSSPANPQAQPSGPTLSTPPQAPPGAGGGAGRQTLDQMRRREAAGTAWGGGIGAAGGRAASRRLRGAAPAPLSGATRGRCSFSSACQWSSRRAATSEGQAGRAGPGSQVVMLRERFQSWSAAVGSSAHCFTLWGCSARMAWSGTV